jgi:hypothetical protein
VGDFYLSSWASPDTQATEEHPQGHEGRREDRDHDSPPFIEIATTPSLKAVMTLDHKAYSFAVGLVHPSPLRRCF